MLNKKALAATAAAQALYVEDVFSCFLYTGNNSTQTITNGIDLSGEGGLVWIKSRNAGYSHSLFDTVRGANERLVSNATAAQSTTTDYLTSFSSTGFSLGADISVNGTGVNLASWTFRKAEKFFDVVTYTGNGVQDRQITHNLGSTPGCILLKRTDTSSDWVVWHRSSDIGSGLYGNARLNGTEDFNYQSGLNFRSGINYPPTSSYFTVANFSAVNASGGTYVAYLFAHDAGGFGDSGSDNVISCGSYTGNSSTTGPVINLGYEPQWVMIKRATNASGAWYIVDNMRGFAVTGNTANLIANGSQNENGYWAAQFAVPNATGFQIVNTDSEVNLSGDTYIYIAIRRGPMKTPEAGTSVFEPLARSGTGAAATVTTTVRPDGVLQNWRSGGLGSASHFFYDRLRGVAKALFTDTTDAESTQTATGINAFNNLSYGIAGAGSMNNGSATYVDYIFTRAPGFFDVVCYAGNTTIGRTVSHNLGVVPELIIVKNRTLSDYNWKVYSATLGNTSELCLDLSNGVFTSVTTWNSTTPTSTQFSLYNTSDVNGNGYNYVAYLFTTLAGVSKVGSYTGTGTTLQVNCGFTSGARFVLIKRTDSTGDWYVWDTARGIVSGNDPYLLLNSTAAEVTNTDYIDTYSQGFEISSTAPAAINANGGTFIFLAIA